MKAGQSKLSAMLRGEAFFSSLLVIVFFMFGIVGLLHHPMWRDETYSWLIARFSGSLRELYLLAQHDAHFMLWDLMLWILTRFTHNCQAMQWFHLALATGSVWLVLWFGPFTRTQKVLYCFGYFTVFEYCLVCREYVCIGLLMFSLCALCDRRKDSFVAQALILFLLSNIDIFATFIAFSFVAARALEHLRRGGVGQLWATKKWALIISGLILCAALLGNGLQLIKPPDALASTGWRHPMVTRHFTAALSNVWRGYVPIPRGFPHLLGFEWGPNFLLDRAPGKPTLGVLLSLGLVAASTWTLRRSAMAVTWYLSGTCLMLLFQSVIAPGALRHHGLYFMLYLACLWCRSTWGTTRGPRPAAAESPSARLEHFFLTSLLVVQVAAGVYVWIMHFQSPFSGSKQVADFIRRNGYANLLIVGSREAKVSPVTAYLDRPIYYPESERYGTFYSGSSARRDFSMQEAFFRTAQLARTEHADVLLVVDGSLHISMSVKGVKVPLTSGWLYPDNTLSSDSEPPVKPHYMEVSILARFEAIVDENYSLCIVRGAHEN